MNNKNNYCVSKDFLRNAYPICEGIAFSFGKSKKNIRDGEEISFYLLPIMRGICELSEEYIFASSCVPLREEARRLVQRERGGMTELRRTLASCRREDLSGACEEARLICQRMVEELRCAEICERINTDYISFMLPLLRAKARISESFLRRVKCKGLARFLREEADLCREELSFLETYVTSAN